MAALFLCASCLSDARVAVAVDRNRRPRRRSAQLNAMLHALEDIDDVPIGRLEAARDLGAALHVAFVHFSTATHVGADCGAGDCAPRGGDVLAASTADLVTEDAPDHAAHDRPWNVGAAALM